MRWIASLLLACGCAPYGETQCVERPVFEGPAIQAPGIAPAGSRFFVTWNVFDDALGSHDVFAILDADGNLVPGDRALLQRGRPDVGTPSRHPRALA